MGLPHKEDYICVSYLYLYKPEANVGFDRARQLYLNIQNSTPHEHKNDRLTNCMPALSLLRSGFICSSCVITVS